MEEPVVEILLKEYEQVNENFRMLADIRFKLLALVPALGGAATFVLSGFALSKDMTAPPHSLVLMIALMGFLATLGITIYDQRNSELYNALIGRARDLEVMLKLPAKGQFWVRPDRDRYLFWLLPMGHDIGLSIIYGPVLGAWAFPVAYVVHTFLQRRLNWEWEPGYVDLFPRRLRFFTNLILHWGSEPRYVALGIAFVMGTVFTLELLRHDKSLPWQKDTQEGTLKQADPNGDFELSYDARNLPRTLKGKMTDACKKQLRGMGKGQTIGKMVVVDYRTKRTKTAGGQRKTRKVITKVIFPGSEDKPSWLSRIGGKDGDG
jgi:hypothetical protein